jgi:hypothetical protein
MSSSMPERQPPLHFATAAENPGRNSRVARTWGGMSGRSSAVRYCPLAAQRLVGHIGLTGDVAEWLKAAVC